MSSFTLPAMPRFTAVLRQWVRRAEPAPAGSRCNPDAPPLIYRLRSWPQLDEAGRTAPIYRMLSIMSNRPISRAWILANLGMEPAELDPLLAQLVECGAVEVIDPSGFPRQRA